MVSATPAAPNTHAPPYMIYIIVIPDACRPGKRAREPDRQDADRHQHHPDTLAERLAMTPEFHGEDDHRQGRHDCHVHDDGPAQALCAIVSQRNALHSVCRRRATPITEVSFLPRFPVRVAL